MNKSTYIHITRSYNISLRVMQTDAVQCTATNKLRRHFYTLLDQLAKHSDLTGFARYMRQGLSEIEELSGCESIASLPYLKRLYALQLIHPKNVEFLNYFAERTGNVDLKQRIVAYYDLVGGKEELLILAKFNTSSGLFIEQSYPPQTQIYEANHQDQTANYSSSITAAPISDPNPPTTQPNGMRDIIPVPFIYPVTKNTPRGYCVIINNEIFHSTSIPALRERAGTHRDGQQLEQTFRNLNYHTVTYNDLSTTEMINILQHISQINHSQFDSFVCCILSHGNNGRVYGSDSTDVELKYIYSLFDTNSCPTLSERPKIFIIQACRGTNIDKGAKLYEDSQVFQEMEKDLPPPIPFQNHEVLLFCDFLIAYGTVEGFVAWRHPDKGSWFIEILCNNLQRLYDQWDIIQILTFVNLDISQKNTPEGSKQMAAPVNMLKGIFYFKPPANILANYI